MNSEHTHQEAPQEQTVHLTAEQQTNVRELYRKLFERIRDGETHIPSHCIRFGFQSILPAPGNTFEQCHEIAIIFYHELVRMTKEMHAQSGSLTSRECLRFLDVVRTAYFNPANSDVTDFLSDIELMKFTREFTQIPCAHLDIGKHATMKAIQRLGSIDPSQIPALIDALHALPLSERIDLAQLFPNLFRDLETQRVNHAEAQIPGSKQAIDETRQQAVSIMARVMSTLQKDATSALEEIALVNAQNTSLRELQQTVRPEGMQNRLHEKALEDAKLTHENLGKRMHLNTVVQKNEHIVTLGSNAIGIMGPTGVIRDIARCDHTHLEEVAPFETTLLQDLRNRLHLGLTNTLFFEMVDEGILAHISPDITRQKFWQTVFPSLQPHELSACLQALTRERMARKKGASTLLSEGEINIAERVFAMGCSTDAIAVMMEEMRQDPFLKEFDVYLKRFEFFCNVEISAPAGANESKKKKGIPNQAMQSIDCLILAAEQKMATREKLAYTVPDHVIEPEQSALLQTLKSLRDRAYEEDRTLAADFQKRRAEESATYQKTLPLCTAAMQRLNLEMNSNGGKELLTAAFDALDGTYLKNLPSVSVVPAEEFLQGTRFYPFESAEQNEEIATFALLHSPEMRSAVESQLGISYDELSLETLFQLGRFLRHKKPKDFADMRVVLHAQDHGLHTADAKKNVLTSFLACSENVELGNTVLELAKFDWSDSVFGLYANALLNAEQSAREIHSLYAQTNAQTDRTVDDIYRELILGSNELLKRALASHGNGIQAIQTQLFNESAQIRNTNYLLRVLPSQERASLDLNTLKSTRMHGPIPVSALKSNPEYADILKQIVATIQANFPSGDDIDFTERYLSEPHAEFFFSTCGDELLAFFGTTAMPNGERYLDWFNANGDSSVRGLAEATVCTGIRNFPDHQDVYLVAKPHVRSHEIFNRMGFVTYGVTDPDEYKHRYMRCRLLQDEERDRYVGKNLTDSDREQIRATCTDENLMHPLSLQGKEVQVCKVHFHGVDHHDNVVPEDSNHGFIFRELASLCSDNQVVLTAYLRDAAFTNGDQVYYCLFEPSVLDGAAYEALQKSVHDFHQQSAS